MSNELPANERLLADMDAFALGMFGELAKRAEPILEAKLRAAGVTDLRILPRGEAGRMLKESLLEAAAAHFPDVSVPHLRRAADAVFDVDWMDAFGRVRQDLEKDRTAFDVAIGPDVAVVLAGVGLDVIPLDKRTMTPIGTPTRDFRQAATTFGRLKTAFVGYDSAGAPFYAVLTDCVNTMNDVIRNDSRFAHVRQAADRVSYDYRRAPMPFQHAALVIPREAADRFETVVLEDPRLDRGSVMFLAGWRDEDGSAHGTPNDGFFAIPKQLVDAILRNPAMFGWLNAPDGPPASVH